MKYELTSETKKIGTVVLYRIKALRSFGDCKTGDLGGWIGKESNLSQEGNAWVSGDARVSGDAKVYGNAWVYENAWVFGDAQVFGDAWVSGDAQVSGDAPTPNVTESDYVSIGGKKYRLVEVKD